MPRLSDTVYIVDPDEAIRDALTTLLSTLNIHVLCYPDAETFLHCHSAKNLNRGCLLVEIDLPAMSGLALLKQLRAEGARLPIVLLSSTHDQAIADRALQAGANCVADKPLVDKLSLRRLLLLLRQVPAGE